MDICFIRVSTKFTLPQSRRTRAQCSGIAFSRSIKHCSASCWAASWWSVGCGNLCKLLSRALSLALYSCSFCINGVVGNDFPCNCHPMLCSLFRLSNSSPLVWLFVLHSSHVHALYKSIFNLLAWEEANIFYSDLKLLLHWLVTVMGFLSFFSQAVCEFSFSRPTILGWNNIKQKALWGKRLPPLPRPFIQSFNTDLIFLRWTCS